MPIVLTEFTRKTSKVQAVRVTEENFEEIAAWCDGEIFPTISKSEPVGESTYIRVDVHNAAEERHTRAYVGDWVVYTGRRRKGFKVFTNKAFENTFTEASTPVA